MPLFTPFTLRDVTFPNRIAVSPMSQYLSKDGYANDWHLVHLGRFALGGAGLVFTEATAVEDRGRRTHGDLGLWENGQIEGMARIARFLKEQGAVPGVQLGHAGRKASERRPWHGETPVTEEDVALRGEAPWETIGPSAVPYGENWHTPTEMTQSDIDDVLAAFRDSARRADQAGYEVIEVYAAHGFLGHQFYSPVTNKRTDAYGGERENRMRFALETARAIRETWPEGKVLSFRISTTDWVDGGWEVEDSIALAKGLKENGVDMVDCSTGGIGAGHNDSFKPRRMALAQGFQLPLAAQVKRETGIAAMGVGFLWDPEVAQAAIADGTVDMVALARELLDNPNWTLHAARSLGEDKDYGFWKPQFGWWLNKRQRLLDKLNLR
ncbi:NADH:flavin oxidoreductase/NADH oxidase [Denitrobaculum tricleocarpae]|uniref:NADH:flavin oxidoreductase/NADH oxidase n=1 Tax=Denitrobaculum tricleocarpae TaxID=2591009 RepID=A0A545TY20_9PROT|nr:NADH:flavin oxidoreductase/NADH oxidase [Denitrobaculum tricleocarpae]TQV82110.1 NADH:flavin oxidoreductase/NADH oxidase [Denitrobaculum tricleocarpae]